SGLVIGAILLFMATLVFSTERFELSRRIQLEIAARRRLSPLRLLAPGPRRGALFSIALAAAVLFGLAADARYGLGLGTAGTAAATRGDLAHRDLAIVLVTFLAFL